MSDSTRPHPRVERYEPEGRRAALSVDTLYIPPAFRPAEGAVLIVHFHGAPWLMEHHVQTRLPQAALVRVQIGAGSRVYAEAVEKEGLLTRLVEEARAQASTISADEVRFDLVALTAFSAG